MEFVKIGNLFSYLLLFGCLFLSTFVFPVGFYRRELAKVACMPTLELTVVVGGGSRP